LPNNSKAIFGANDNLQTYSDGTDSYVDNTGGELKIRTNELRLLNYVTGKYITADSGADVSLYYNNVKKLETTSTGVTFSNLSNTSAASSSVDEVKIGSFGAGRPAIYFGTSNTTYTNSTWFMENIGASGKFRIGRNGLDIIEISNAGDTSFAGNLGIGGVIASSQLSIGGNAISTLKPTVVISDETNGASLTLRGQSPILYFDGTAAGVPKILMDGQGVEFKTGTLDSQGNVHLKIDSSGNSTFAGEVNASRFILPSTGTTTPANQYLFTDNTNTGT